MRKICNHTITYKNKETKTNNKKPTHIKKLAKLKNIQRLKKRQKLRNNKCVEVVMYKQNKKKGVSNKTYDANISGM
jgi:hypothetical protein